MDKWRFSYISDFENNLKQDGFTIYEIKPEKNIALSYNRRDFIKICLINGKGVIQYSDREIEIDGSTLFIASPNTFYSCKVISNNQASYTCLVTEDFFNGNDCLGEHQYSQLFEFENIRLLNLTSIQRDFLTTIFQKMILEQNTVYVFKDDLIRNHISLIIHESIKTQSTEMPLTTGSSASDTVTQFVELLERQFPIEAQIIFWN